MWSVPVNIFPHCRHAEIIGPSADWYRELAEQTGRPWPRPVNLTQASHGVAIARAMSAASPWSCRKCGGPRICPDLKSTLPYSCGYHELSNGRWEHE